MPANITSDYCFVIPCYNHGETIETVLNNIAVYQLPCFLIDDGSSADTAQQLEQVADNFSWVTLKRLPINQGKGGAVMAGVELALQQGHRYAIQIDADGQHNCQDIDRLLEASIQHPNALISGQPEYDDSVPKHRFIARYITHFWVWVETLSFSLKDSMCGFRIYPLQPTYNIIRKYRIGKRMDFDIEIMVRLYWAGIDSVFVPTKVIYPQNGLSHFKAFNDNLRISWMHTRLFFGMLLRAFSLIKRNMHSRYTDNHWSQTPERKGLWGIKFILWLYRIFGRNTAKCVMFPVITYFWLTGTKQRQSSKSYLQRIKHYQHIIPWVDKKRLTTFRHFYRFGESLLDKLASWQGDIKLSDIYSPNNREMNDVLDKKQGIILIGSHLGDLEMCRAIAELSHDVTINALVFTHHAARFNRILKEINPKTVVNLIQVDSLGADTAILLKQKLDAGEWVTIVGDRTSSNPHQRIPSQSVVWADFLGQPAPFPKGPFVLSSVLGYPVYLIWGLKPNGRFQFYCEHFSNKLVLPRADRQTALESIIQRYAQRLEHYCLISPLDWFNFYDFWQFHQPNQSSQKRNSENEK